MSDRPRNLRLPPDASDVEIALALAALPLPRLQGVARELFGRLEADVRSQLMSAVLMAPAAAGAAASRAVESAVHRILTGPGR